MLIEKHSWKIVQKVTSGIKSSTMNFAREGSKYDQAEITWDIINCLTILFVQLILNKTLYVISLHLNKNSCVTIRPIIT